MMATKQKNSNAAIAQTVAKAASVAIQAMAVAEAKRTQNAGPKLGGPIMKQLTFNWSSLAELRNFIWGKEYVPKL